MAFAVLTCAAPFRCGPRQRWLADRCSPRLRRPDRARLCKCIRRISILAGARVASDRFPVEQGLSHSSRARQNRKRANGRRDRAPPKLLRPSSPRLISDSATYGSAFTCGKSALSCCQRCPRAERISARRVIARDFVLVRGRSRPATIAAELRELAFPARCLRRGSPRLFQEWA